MDTNNIKKLIDNYFEGNTSLEEEEILRDYFRQKNTAIELDSYKPIFRFFAEERSVEKKILEIDSLPEVHPKISENKRVKMLSWISIASVACILIFLGLNFFVHTQKRLPETSIAYIDGKKYTDIELIQSQTLTSLENLTEAEGDIFSSQLEVLESFSNLSE